MNRLLTGWRPYVLAAVVIGFLFALILTLQQPGTRLSDSARQEIEQANCGQLRDMAENTVLRLDRDSTSDETLRAIEYENAAQDRMDELGCFDR